jgi:hypothetical protein
MQYGEPLLAARLQRRGHYPLFAREKRCRGHYLQ